MIFAEDYFSREHFSVEIFSETFEKESSDGVILLFEQLFRRHHVLQDPVNLIDPSGTVPPVVIWTGAAALAGGAGAYIGTLLGGGSHADAVNAIIPGAIGGALAGAAAGATVIAGVATAAGTAAGLVVDLAYNAINAIDAVSGPAPIADVSNGINAIKTNGSCGNK